MIIYNLYYIFYSILDLTLLRLTTAEIETDGIMVLGLIFKSLIDFEFIFVYGVRKYSSMKT